MKPRVRNPGLQLANAFGVRSTLDSLLILRVSKMKKVIPAVLCILLLMGLCQCTRHPNKPQSTLLGRYTLTAHDNSGRLAFTGSISLTSVEQNLLKGQCSIVREPTAPAGLLNQTPRCEALMDGKAVTVDLAPNLSDGGLILEGQFEDGRITGIWRLEGFVGTPPLGKFEAVKK